MVVRIFGTIGIRLGAYALKGFVAHSMMHNDMSVFLVKPRRGAVRTLQQLLDLEFLVRSQASQKHRRHIA